MEKNWQVTGVAVGSLNIFSLFSGRMTSVKKREAEKRSFQIIRRNCAAYQSDVRESVQNDDDDRPGLSVSKRRSNNPSTLDAENWTRSSFKRYTWDSSFNCKLVGEVAFRGS